MDQPTHRHTLTLAETVAQERAQIAAGAKGCARQCDDGCHGDLACVRVEHPHDPDKDMGTDPTGRPLPRGDVVPHVAAQADGSLVQWTCLPGDHDGLTVEQRADKRSADEATAREQATRDLLAAIDSNLLAQRLRGGGHLP